MVYVAGRWVAGTAVLLVVLVLLVMLVLLAFNG